jgi:hypothetical protein
MEGFTFDPDTHVGKMNGIPWPSVTQLLQESKLIDYTGVPRDILERKRILGTRVHAATIIVDEGAGALDEEHFNANFPECVPYLDAYRKFRVMEKFDPAPEKIGRLVSKKWRFHGEPDEHGVRLMMRAGENYLIDYKCTFKMFASTGPQLAGYQILLAERGIKIKHRFGLLLKPNGSYDPVEFKDPLDRQDFLACLWLHWQRRDKYKTGTDLEKLLNDV